MGGKLGVGCRAIVNGGWQRSLNGFKIALSATKSDVHVKTRQQ